MFTDGRPAIVTPPANTTAVSGSDVILHCNTNRRIQYTVNFIWLKGGHPVQNLILVSSEDPQKGEALWAMPTESSIVTSPEGVFNPNPGRDLADSRFRVLPTGSLQILNVQMSDGGQYACVVWDVEHVETEQQRPSASASAHLVISAGVNVFLRTNF